MIRLKKDCFGDRSISILGDSITHGASADDVATQSYVGLFKQEIARRTGVRNYGFTSVEDRMWSNGGMQKEAHTVAYEPDDAWLRLRVGENLGNYSAISSRQGAQLAVTVPEGYAWGCIYYMVGPAGGSFTVTAGQETVARVSTAALETACMRTSYLPLQGGTLRLTVTSREGPVTILGIAYYNQPQEVVVHNYANCCLRLVDVGTEVLKTVCSSSIVILALGYNDLHFNAPAERFSQQIRTVSEEIRRSGSRLYVEDFCWNMPEDQYYRLHLKRLAIETGGIYITPQAVYGERLLREIKDEAHPSPEGHRLLAEELLRRFDWDWQE